MKSRIGWMVSVLLAFVLGIALPLLILWNPAGWKWADGWIDSGRHTSARPDHEQEGQLWTCGMHPQVIEQEPGDCPICGMQLMPVKDTGAEGRQQETEPNIRYWRAPMDPGYISDKPGKSPMGMDLIPVYEDPVEASRGIRVDPNFLQNFSVRTAVVERGDIPLGIKTIGALHYNEKRIVSVNTKFEGWIEKARVNYQGQQVHKGDVLFEIFSPQLLTTQQEYLAAIDYLARLQSQADSGAVRRAQGLVEAARQRLHFWDVTDDQIADLRKQGKTFRRLKILSPVSGIMVEKASQSLEGMKVSPGMNVYKIANLATVWALVEVFEHQIQHLRVGQRVRLTVDAFPGRTWRGAVIRLNPELDTRTRTLGAQVEVPNPGGRLRPGMYANIEIEVPGITGAVIVPEEAILHTGERSVVIVQKDRTIFQAKEVELGAAGNGFQEVRKGLNAGERVVTSSQFLLDSESNLREAISKMTAKTKAQNQEPPHLPAEHQ